MEFNFNKKNEEYYDLDKVSNVNSLNVEISKLIGKLDPDGEMDASILSSSEIYSIWSNIAGEQIMQITRSVYIKNNEIVIILNSSIWAQELNFLSLEYAKKFNESLKIDSIKKVTFKVR
jgi:hypothetical protein